MDFVSLSEFTIDAVTEVQPSLNLLLETDLDGVVDHHAEIFEYLPSLGSRLVVERDGFDRLHH